MSGMISPAGVFALLFGSAVFADQPPAGPACEGLPYSTDNCVRVLACIGQGGLWFDGQARGWNEGTVQGATSDGVACSGRWRSGGFLGTGSSRMECADGRQVAVVYFMQDNETGTVVGRGQDDRGTGITVWTGQNVLEYLTPRGTVGASLPCGPMSIPVG